MLIVSTSQEQAAGPDWPRRGDDLDSPRFLICAFKGVGYDYVKLPGSDSHMVRAATKA